MRYLPAIIASLIAFTLTVSLPMLFADRSEKGDNPFPISASREETNTLAELHKQVDLNGMLERIAQILGRDFPENAIAIDAEREGVRLAGFAGIPSFNRANSLHQFAYVNGRPVRDKQIWGAIRGAYADVISRDRHPVLALFINLDPELVDVNVHPAKADVRFRDPGLVRGLIVGSIRTALANSGIKAATSGADAMLRAFRPGNGGGEAAQARPHAPASDLPYTPSQSAWAAVHPARPAGPGAAGVPAPPAGRTPRRWPTRPRGAEPPPPDRVGDRARRTSHAAWGTRGVG